VIVTCGPEGKERGVKNATGVKGERVLWSQKVSGECIKKSMRCKKQTLSLFFFVFFIIYNELDSNCIFLLLFSENKKQSSKLII